MKKIFLTFDSEQIHSHRFIHFQSNPEINFANESTKVSVYTNNSHIPYSVAFVEKYIQQIHQHKTTYFNVPIPPNCNHLEIMLIGYTNYYLNKIKAKPI